MRVEEGEGFLSGELLPHPFTDEERQRYGHTIRTKHSQQTEPFEGSSILKGDNERKKTQSSVS